MSRRTENSEFLNKFGDLCEKAGISKDEAMLGILADISVSLADIADSLRKMNKI